MTFPCEIIAKYIEEFNSDGSLNLSSGFPIFYVVSLRPQKKKH